MGRYDATSWVRHRRLGPVERLAHDQCLLIQVYRWIGIGDTMPRREIPDHAVAPSTPGTRQGTAHSLPQRRSATGRDLDVRPTA